MELIQPCIEYKSAYLDMMKDWEATSEDLVPFPLDYDYSDFPAFIEKCNSFRTIQDPGFVHHSTFWLMAEGKIVGVSNIRHYLTNKLLKEGGHIGFGVRPSFRKMGYATKILKLSLIEAKKLGIDKVLVTCAKDNIGSSKTIIKNGGILWKEHFYNDRFTLNYWIALN